MNECSRGFKTTYIETGFQIKLKTSAAFIDLPREREREREVELG